MSIPTNDNRDGTRCDPSRRAGATRSASAIARLAVVDRRQRFIKPRGIGGMHIPSGIFEPSRAFCRPTPMSYDELYELSRSPGLITSALCWSHVRCQFFELADIAANARRGKTAAAISPVALEAVRRIDVLFDISVVSMVGAPKNVCGYGGKKCASSDGAGSMAA
jgi:hypothetical protein